MTDFCLFAHFDVHARLDPYVLRYLEKLKDCGFSIVLVSATPLPREDVIAARLHCIDVMTRENVGLDFASWAEAFSKHKDAITGRLLLANDSVYGPIGDLSAPLAELTKDKADFYGMVASLDIAPHLQSWFLLFENHVIRDEAFARILEQPFATMTKSEVIHKGEVGISVALMAAGYKFHAMYRPDGLGPMARRMSINPSYALWREMVAVVGIPFVKVAVVRDLLTHSAVRRFLGSCDPWLADAIVQHQQRTALAPQKISRFFKIHEFLIRTDHWLHRHGFDGLARGNDMMYKILRRAIHGP